MFCGISRINKIKFKREWKICYPFSNMEDVIRQMLMANGKITEKSKYDDVEFLIEALASNIT